MSFLHGLVSNTVTHEIMFLEPDFKWFSLGLTNLYDSSQFALIRSNSESRVPKRTFLGPGKNLERGFFGCCSQGFIRNKLAFNMCDMFFDTMTIIPENMHIFRYEIQNGAEDALQDCLF